MSQETEPPGDRLLVELTLTENQVHDILGGLAWGADYAEAELDPDIAEEMRTTRDVVVEQFNSQEPWPRGQRPLPLTAWEVEDEAEQAARELAVALRRIASFRRSLKTNNSEAEGQP